MEDRDLIRMFWERNETAISEAQKIYQRYIRAIAKRILGNDQDAEEVENTVYLKLWNRIPPEDPPSLKAMVGMLTRQTSIDERRKKQSLGRGEGAYEESLEELAECLPDAASEDPEDRLHLTETLDRFLASLSSENRRMFLHRYWYFCSIREIAESAGYSESKVKMNLLRTRNELKVYLEQEGISL